MNKHFDILKKYNVIAKKSLGQNFLVDDNILDKIVTYKEIFWENIVEVWPGYWALTEKLLNKKPKSLKLIELDLDMVKILEDRISNKELNIQEIDFEIKNIDVLKFELNEEHKDYNVIANIPYYITSPILRHFLYDVKFSPKSMIILMQKDVWDKILSDKSSVLWLFVAKKCFVKQVVLVPNSCFFPVPKVESIVLYFEKHNIFDEICSDEDFLKIIKMWFKEARKKLIKNFISSWFPKEKLLSCFKELNISETTRAEELNIDIWCNLVKLICL